MTAAIDRADAISRRRARMMPMFAVLLLAQQSVFWSADGRAVSIVHMVAWTVMVLAMLLLVAGGGFLMSRDVRALANDEVTEANRAIAIRRGFVAATLMAVIVFAVSPFEPITAQRAAHLIVSLGLGIALLSFGLLERKSLAEELTNRVREAREARGWTQAELAERMGVSRKTVNTVENGVFVPSTIVALKAARVLGEPVEALFALVE